MPSLARNHPNAMKAKDCLANQAHANAQSRLSLTEKLAVSCCWCMRFTFFLTDFFAWKVAAKGISSACVLSSECDTKAGLVCVSQKCSCQPTKYFNGQSCGKFSVWFKVFQRKSSHENPYFLINEATKLSYNQPCTIANSCNDALSLSCVNGVCGCKASDKYDGQKCSGKMLKARIDSRRW